MFLGMEQMRRFGAEFLAERFTIGFDRVDVDDSGVDVVCSRHSEDVRQCVVSVTFLQALAMIRPSCNSQHRWIGNYAG